MGTSTVCTMETGLIWVCIMVKYSTNSVHYESWFVRMRVFRYWSCHFIPRGSAFYVRLGRPEAFSGANRSERKHHLIRLLTFTALSLWHVLLWLNHVSFSPFFREKPWWCIIIMIGPGPENASTQYRRSSLIAQDGACTGLHSFLTYKYDKAM